MASKKRTPGDKYSALLSPDVGTAFIPMRIEDRDIGGATTQRTTYRGYTASPTRQKELIADRDKRIGLIFEQIDNAVRNQIQGGRRATQGGIAGVSKLDPQRYIDKLPEARAGILSVAQRSKLENDIKGRFKETRDLLKSKTNLKAQNASRGTAQTLQAFNAKEKLQPKDELGV